MFIVLPPGWSRSGVPTPWLMAGVALHAKQQKALLTLPLLRIEPFAYKALPAVFALKATQGQEQLFPGVVEPCGMFLFFTFSSSFFMHNLLSQCTQPGLTGFGTTAQDRRNPEFFWNGRHGFVGTVFFSVLPCSLKRGPIIDISKWSKCLLMLINVYFKQARLVQSKAPWRSALPVKDDLPPCQWF